VEAIEPELVHERHRLLDVEREAVFARRLRAPLAQAAADRVGADHAKALRQVLGQVVHVAAGARQAVPGDDRLAVLLPERSCPEGDKSIGRQVTL